MSPTKKTTAAAPSKPRRRRQLRRRRRRKRRPRSSTRRRRWIRAPSRTPCRRRSTMRSARAGTRSRPMPTSHARERLILHYAPLVKYVASRVATGLPGLRRSGRPRVLRDVRADRRAAEVRARARQQVRDVRDPTDPRGDHRRAPRDGLGAALGAVQAARDREGARRPRVDAEAPALGERARRAPRHVAARAARGHHADLVRVGARPGRDGLGRRGPRREGVAGRHAGRQRLRPDQSASSRRRPAACWRRRSTSCPSARRSS